MTPEPDIIVIDDVKPLPGLVASAAEHYSIEVFSAPDRDQVEKLDILD